MIIVQVVIVFVPVLIPGQIAQGDPVYRNVVCAAAFQIVGHFTQESALKLATVRNAPGQVHVREDDYAMMTVVAFRKCEIPLLDRRSRLV